MQGIQNNKRMKKILLTIFAILMTLTFCLSAGALKEYTKDDMAEDEFILASIHNTSSFVVDDTAIDALHSSLAWAISGRDTHNVKSVALVGPLTTGSKTNYAQYVVKEKHSYDEYINECLAEQAWHEEWQRLAAALERFADNSIPHSLATAINDYPASAGRRNNLYSTYFNVNNLFPKSIKSTFYDDLNYYYLFTGGDVNYIAFNLELFPRQAVLEWVSQCMAEHSDRRAIIYTHSFLEANGEMIHMFDWDDYVGIDYPTFVNKYMKAPDVTSKIRSVNISGTGRPHDGDGLWEKYFKKYDNLFLIITSNNASPSQITTKLLVNDAGYDVLAVSANSGTGIDIKYLFTGIADNGETVNLNYYSALDEAIDENASKSFTLNLKDVPLASEKGPDISYLMQIEGQVYGANTAYINGLGDNRFGPQENMTRAQAITIVARLIDSAESFKGQYKSNFTDVSESDWFYDYVSFLYCGRILERYGDTLEPNKPITRGEFVELLYLANAFPESPRIVAFKDVPKGGGFFDAVSAAAATGIVNGYEDGTFRPDNNITRAEMATLINRALGISATEKLVDESSLETVFSDIDGHWAYYNILMSANSNVKGESIVADVDTSRIIDSDKTVTLSTNHVDIVINKSNGAVASVINKATGKDVSLTTGVLNFVYLKDSGGNILPNGLEFKDNKLVFTFRDGTVVNVIADVRDEFIILEVENEIPNKYVSVEFGNVNLKYELSDNNIAAITYTMKVNTNPVEYPDGKSMSTRASAFSSFGTTGAKAAFIIAPKNLHRDYMKLAMEEIDRNEGIVSHKGGAYALDYAGNFGDYMIFSDSDPGKVQSWIDFYTQYDLDTIDFHNTHRHGDFVSVATNLSTKFKSVLEFFLEKNGIATDAQPYSYYASPEGLALLGDAWSADIKHLGTFTLAKDIGRFATSINIEENAELLQAATAGYNNVYVAVDNELVSGKVNGNKIDNLSRNRGETVSAKHIKGTKLEVFVIEGTGAAAFKGLVSDPLEEAGITSGLHTYSYYIHPDASQILSDPYWLAQLETMEVFTLASDIDEKAATIPTVESTAGKTINTNFFAHDSHYIVIDDELILMNFGSDGFVRCNRGRGGTVAAPHKAGATIRHIGGCFNHLAPDMDSELFLEVARRTAEAYNEGGFEMIYLDALDGLGRHTSSSNNNGTNTWYYAAKFVNEILKHCDTEPIIEYSTNPASIWAGRGRMGARDTASRAFKIWNEAHTEENIVHMDRYYAATLGWYNFYPNSGGALYDWEKSEGYPGNFWNKYQFFDDIDHMGSLAIAYNMSIVYNPLTESSIDIPAFKRNIENYTRYNVLRKENYFSEEARATMRDTMLSSDIEYALVDKPDGSYALVEKYYVSKKLNRIDSGENVISGNNPFEAQKPFIRIQNYSSTDGSDPITLITFDETKELTSQTLSKTLPNLNLMKNLAFKIKVYGNNSNDAIAIKVGSVAASEKGYYQYVIPLDFEGWKEFVLAEPDNGDLTLKYGFSIKTVHYGNYRAHVDYKLINSVQIVTSGKCEGVKVGTLTAEAHLNNPIVNPTISLGSESVTFNTTLNSSEYLEYNADDAVAYVYDAVGNSREVTVTGTTPTLPNGDFKATITGTDSDTMPMRAEVTFGFAGKELR